MTGVAHLKIDLDGFNGADSPPLGARTRVLLDPQVDVTDLQAHLTWTFHARAPRGANP